MPSFLGFLATGLTTITNLSSRLASDDVAFCTRPIITDRAAMHYAHLHQTLDNNVEAPLTESEQAYIAADLAGIVMASLDGLIRNLANKMMREEMARRGSQADLVERVAERAEWLGRAAGAVTSLALDRA